MINIKKLAVLHTSFVSIEDLKALFAEIIPDVEIMNIVDDSLLSEVMREGHVTYGIRRRMAMYMLEAEKSGADLILNQCSSVSESAGMVQSMLKIPVLKIDAPMAEKAVLTGIRIALIATVESTVGPSRRLLEEYSKKMNKENIITEYLVADALSVLLRGDREKHNLLVIEKIEQASLENDVIVLAQGSMTRLLPLLKHIKVPVLSSPRLAVEKVKEILEV